MHERIGGGVLDHPLEPALGRRFAPTWGRVMTAETAVAAIDQNTFHRSRGADASELCERSVPLQTEGAGKAGCPPHPRPPCIKKARGENHRYGRNNPAFPARWLYDL